MAGWTRRSRVVSSAFDERYQQLESDFKNGSREDMVHSLDLLCRNYSCSCVKASRAYLKGWNPRRLDTLSIALTGCIVCTARSHILL